MAARTAPSVEIAPQPTAPGKRGTGRDKPKHEKSAKREKPDTFESPPETVPVAEPEPVVEATVEAPSAESAEPDGDKHGKGHGNGKGHDKKKD